MIFDLAALWLIVWMLKNAAMDVSCAVTGKPNPRYELKKAKAKAAGQPAPTQPRYGTRDWFNDLLSDGLQAQTEWRRRRAATKRKAREQTEAEQTETEQAEPAEPAEQGQQTDTTGRSVSDPAQTSEPATGGAAGPEQQAPPTAPQPPASGPTAQIIPFPTSKENSDVTTAVNSEVIGLDQSIAYARSLARFAAEHGQAGNEGYIGHLTGSKVTGQGLSTAHEMQEAFTLAAAAADRHAAALERQRAVQEQYDANPDAGDKAFQTEGR